MTHVHFTEFQQNLAAHLDEVIQNRSPLLVTRQGQEAAYVIAEGEFESMLETLHLLSNPRNADRIREGIAQLESGNGVERGQTL